MTTTWKVEWATPEMAYAATPRAADTTHDVLWTSASGEEFVSHLLPYDALSMAKELVFNNYANVRLVTTTRTLDAAAIRAARY